jgi:hypothetical protein
METKYQVLKNCILAISTILLSLRLGPSVPTPPFEFNIHPYRPRDYVLIKTWKAEKLQLTWEGLYQVFLTIETVVYIAEQGWTHHTRIESPGAIGLLEHHQPRQSPKSHLEMDKPATAVTPAPYTSVHKDCY